MWPLLPRGRRQLLHHSSRLAALCRDAAQHQPGLPGSRLLRGPAHRLDLFLQGQERLHPRYRSVGLPRCFWARRRPQYTFLVSRRIRPPRRLPWELIVVT